MIIYFCPDTRILSSVMLCMDKDLPIVKFGGLSVNLKLTRAFGLMQFFK